MFAQQLSAGAGPVKPRQEALASPRLHRPAPPATRAAKAPPPHQRLVPARAAPMGTATALLELEVGAPATTLAPPKRSVEELTPDNFAAVVHDPSEPLTVVDYYTDWCGPCQIMLKELDKLTDAFPTVNFYKLNCGKYDKAWVSSLRVRSLPTLKIYHRGRFIEEITGAKPAQLRQLLAHYSIVAR